jgi:uncharacterized protein with von Willebrand factor type A (vWA) domain
VIGCESGGKVAIARGLQRAQQFFEVQFRGCGVVPAVAIGDLEFYDWRRTSTRRCTASASGNIHENAQILLRVVGV